MDIPGPPTIRRCMYLAGLKYSIFFRSAFTTPNSTTPPSQQPWYETNLFWGSFGFCSAIVLTVVAAMVKDLRWLLLLAWPAGCVTVWAISKNVRTAGWKWAFRAGGWGAIGAALLYLNTALKPPAPSQQAVNPGQQQEATKQSAVPSTPTSPPSQKQEPTVSPIESLAALGWTVTPDESTEIEFSINSKPLPDMVKSARLLRLVDKSFKLRLQVVKSISGLTLLRGIKNFTSLTLNSIDSRDLSELGGLTSITKLEISQVQAGDMTPLLGLRALRELVLSGNTAVRDLGSLVNLRNLTKLSLNNTPISNLSPLHGMRSLTSLDLTGTNVTDLTPLASMQGLHELAIDGRPLTEFHRLAGFNIKKLKILNHNSALDIGPLGDLVNLEDLDIMAPVRLNLYPLRKLQRLSRLGIIGTNISFNDDSLVQIQDAEAIGELHALKALVLARVQISDIGFIVNLGNLEELTMNFLPLNDIRQIRSVKSLVKVAFAADPLVDISPLLDLPNLKEINVQSTPARSDTLTILERRGVSVRR